MDELTQEIESLKSQIEGLQHSLLAVQEQADTTESYYKQKEERVQQVRKSSQCLLDDNIQQQIQEDRLVIQGELEDSQKVLETVEKEVQALLGDKKALMEQVRECVQDKEMALHSME